MDTKSVRNSVAMIISICITVSHSVAIATEGTKYIAVKRLNINDINSLFIKGHY